jgi:hypothetical protein
MLKGECGDSLGGCRVEDLEGVWWTPSGLYSGLLGGCMAGTSEAVWRAPQRVLRRDISMWVTTGWIVE